MKKFVGLLLLVFLSTLISHAQVLEPDPVLGPRAWEKENNEQREAIVLTHIREADVMWSTRIWRELDLRQKINQPLYFPIDSAVHGKRSFIQILYDLYLNNENNFGPNGVKLYKSSQFEEIYTYEEVMRWILPGDTVPVVNTMTCDDSSMFVNKDWNEIKALTYKVQLMEDWFFDKQRSVMDVRILGLGLTFQKYTPTFTTVPACFDATTFKELEIVLGVKGEVWFYFPQIRQELSVLECYKRQNDAARLSYDDIFLQRIFSSYIIKEENVYDRSIDMYTAGLDALLEAEAIKAKIFQFEQDVWQY